MNDIIDSLTEQFITGLAPTELIPVAKAIGARRLHILAAVLLDAIALEKLPMELQEHWQWRKDLDAAFAACPKLNAVFAIEENNLVFSPNVSIADRGLIKSQVTKR